jgi:hypothetical protein
VTGSRRWWWLGIAALLAVGAGLLWSGRGSDEPPRAGESPATAREPGAGTDARGVSPAGGERTTEPGLPASGSRAARSVLPPGPVFDATVHHTADPCTAPIAPTIPAGYERTTLSGITVAWQPVDAAARQPTDAVLDPIVIAAAATGILEQAALATGTERRAELTIVVYPSGDELRARTGSPSWAEGLYDGGAVRLPLAGRGDLGVAMLTLRHELMHAQIHEAVGCVPAWFNEGIAMYFAGTPPVREWLAMLRHPEAFDVAALQRDAIDDKQPERARRLYAQSLALVVYLAERTGDGALRQASQQFHADGRWDKHYPQLDGRAVLDALARKIFGVGLGSDLDAALGGVVCCYGLKTVSEFGCRGGAARPGEHAWRDTTTTPAAWCDDRY